ncbi:MAG: 1-deoxy-D-xylulose-5-phosphate synthase [Fibrobacteria bacterium]|nr:1-deoxy-D-xylulose-5-phosphate synthase [Fibrobacteria bacterium]
MLEKIDSPKNLKNLSKEELHELCSEIRNVIVKQVSKTGGHLASNLGVVELTLALHYVFDTPDDKIIWDVGHQAYPHKLITGRFHQFHTLKQKDGLSGFPSRKESAYDAFGVGHASTSLAAAMGFAVARTLKQQANRVVAVIGDGSLTGGLAYEALNNAGVSEENVIFILNDNTMSIAPNVGAVSKYLNHIIANPIYNKLKKEVWEFTAKFHQLGEGIRKIVQKVDGSVKNLFLPGELFEDLGIRYFGPINGHNLNDLIKILNHLKDAQGSYIKGPCLIHVLTEKGHGWDTAVKDAYKWHASTPFDIKTGKKKASITDRPGLAKIVGDTLCSLFKDNQDCVGITAAMPDGTGMEHVINEYPERVFDVGIAESYAVTFAAGLACEKIKPFVAIYSTFLQRSLDQIIHDVALQNLPVVFILSHSGLVGVDGPTHHGTFDLTYLRMIPDMTVLAPSDEIELVNMIHLAYKHTGGPIAIRYPKGHALHSEYSVAQNTDLNIKKGVPHIIHQGDDLLILSVGFMKQAALEVYHRLKKDGFNPTLADARYVKPLDPEKYQQLIEAHKAVLTIEESMTAGGYGSGISEFMAAHNIQKPIKHIGIPDTFAVHARLSELHSMLGLDADSIYNNAKEFMSFALSSVSQLQKASN